MKELIDKRTSTSKTFALNDGKFKLSTQMSPLHFLDESNKFQNIDLTFKIDNDKIYNNDGIYTVEAFTDSIGYSFIHKKNKKRIDVRLYSIEDKLVTNIPKPTIEKNKVYWKNVNGIDFELEMLTQRVRLWKILKDNKIKNIKWSVYEDNNKTGCYFVDNSAAYDANKKEVHIISTLNFQSNENINNKSIKKSIYEEVFTEKTLVRNKKTRVKELSKNIKYPVRIDTDVNVDIINNADDGYSWYDTLYISGGWNARMGYYASYYQHAFMRFSGITIPQGATINSAILTFYVSGPGYDQVEFKIYADDQNNPTAPTSVADLEGRTRTTAFADVAFPGTTYHNTEFDVSSVIEELTTTYDLDTDAILFLLDVSNAVEGYRYWEDYSDVTYSNHASLDIIYNQGETFTQSFGESISFQIVQLEQRDHIGTEVLIVDETSSVYNKRVYPKNYNVKIN